jgi:hypothetical protein
MRRVFECAAVFACVVGVGNACSLTGQQQAANVAPVVINAACGLAADQGSAEPGWEMLVCDVLSPGDGGAIRMKLPVSVSRPLRGATP